MCRLIALKINRLYETTVTSDDEVIIDAIPTKLKHTEGNTLEFKAQCSPAPSWQIRYGVRGLLTLLGPFDGPGICKKQKTKFILFDAGYNLSK
jgi:hypothetical protein